MWLIAPEVTLTKPFYVLPRLFSSSESVRKILGSSSFPTVDTSRNKICISLTSKASSPSSVRPTREINRSKIVVYLVRRILSSIAPFPSRIITP